LLSYLSVAYLNVPTITGLLYGVQPVVIAIVVEAVLRIGKRTLHHSVLVAFAILAFVALYFLSIPFPLVVAVAALAGLLSRRWLPNAFRTRGHGSSGADEEEEAAVEETSPGNRPTIG
jgi:chromate transporter